MALPWIQKAMPMLSDTPWRPTSPLPPATFQSTLTGSQGGFVTKLNPTGSALVYSTYLAGDRAGWAGAIAIIDSGDAYLTGWTISAKFPTTHGAYQTTYPGAKNETRSAFVSELNPTGTGLVFSTYLGGSGNSNDDGDWGNAIAVGPAGQVYVAGRLAFLPISPSQKTPSSPPTNPPLSKG